ncbi:protein of unknown function [Streptomyces murinus]
MTVPAMDGASPSCPYGGLSGRFLNAFMSSPVTRGHASHALSGATDRSAGGACTAAPSDAARQIPVVGGELALGHGDGRVGRLSPERPATSGGGSERGELVRPRGSVLPFPLQRSCSASPTMMPSGPRT